MASQKKGSGIMVEKVRSDLSPLRKKIKLPENRPIEGPVVIKDFDKFVKGLKEYVPKSKPQDPREIKMFVCEFEPLDTTDAFPITYDHQDLQQNDINLSSFGTFVRTCYNKHALQIYDHPGLLITGGFYHLEGESIKPFYQEPAKYAFNWYTENCSHGLNKQLKEVTKLSCFSQCSHPVNFVTFTVFDKDTKEETSRDQTTLQALVLEYGLPRMFLIGMLRDASHDQVLAIIQFKEAPTGVVAGSLLDVLKKVGEKGLVEA